MDKKKWFLNLGTVMKRNLISADFSNAQQTGAMRMKTG